MPTSSITDPWFVAVNCPWEPIQSNIPEFKGKVIPAIRVDRLQEELHAITGNNHDENNKVYVNVLRGRVAYGKSRSLGNADGKPVDAFYVTDPQLASAIEATAAYQVRLKALTERMDGEKTHVRHPRPSETGHTM